MRTPTQKQYEKLRVLSLGTAGLSWSKRETAPLLAHGWVTADWDGHFFQWVQITADGLRALARAVDRYGLPPMLSGKRSVKVCSDCERDWDSACRYCGSRTYRYRTDELERVVA